MNEPTPSALAIDTSLWARFVSLLSVIGTTLILVVMVVMVWDVLARAAFNRPLSGTAEIVTMSIAAIVFLQMPSALAAGRFVRSDALLKEWRSSRPAHALKTELIWVVLGTFTFALLAWAAAPLVYKDFVRGELYGSPGVFTFPRWPVGCLVVLGCVATSIQFGVQGTSLLRSRGVST